MVKRKKKKRGIPILGWLVGGLTIAVGVLGSTGKAVGLVEEENGNGPGTRPPPPPPIDCPPEAVCGDRPPRRTLGTLGHTWVQRITCNAGWIAGDLPKIEFQKPPNSFWIDRGGFNQPLIDWAKCACREGLI